jgi:hypothetical protein
MTVPWWTQALAGLALLAVGFRRGWVQEACRDIVRSVRQ